MNPQSTSRGLPEDGSDRAETGRKQSAKKARSPKIPFSQEDEFLISLTLFNFGKHPQFNPQTIKTWDYFPPEQLTKRHSDDSLRTHWRRFYKQGRYGETGQWLLNLLYALKWTKTKKFKTIAENHPKQPWLANLYENSEINYNFLKNMVEHIGENYGFAFPWEMKYLDLDFTPQNLKEIYGKLKFSEKLVKIQVTPLNPQPTNLLTQFSAVDNTEETGKTENFNPDIEPNSHETLADFEDVLIDDILRETSVDNFIFDDFDNPIFDMPVINSGQKSSNASQSHGKHGKIFKKPCFYLEDSLV